MGLHVEFVPLNAYYWPWVQQRAQQVQCADTKGIVALRNGIPVAAVVMDNWSHNACQTHIAIEDPLVLRHGFLEEIARYVFEQCGRGVIIGITPADNEKALKFNKHIGFEEIYRVRDGHKVGIDYVIQEIRKEKCRWLKRIQEAAA